MEFLHSNVFHRKLYAFLRAGDRSIENADFWCRLSCLDDNIREELEQWWQQVEQSEASSAKIASSSDRVNLIGRIPETILVKHPISGQEKTLTGELSGLIETVPEEIYQEQDIKKVFWWFWRFSPLVMTQKNADYWLYPAHYILPDCPLHSHKSTVSALVGAMYPLELPEEKEYQHPYLILFTFSPVQEFIKSSRKFLDFWAGSYLLHYLSVRLCGEIALIYGPDAVIVPSLWGQEIIDALILKQFGFQESYQRYTGSDPISRFDSKNPSLTTAGFPNVITALVPGKEEAEKLGESLKKHLKSIWKEMAVNVRNDVKKKVIAYLQNEANRQALDEIVNDSEDLEQCKRDLKQWQTGTCWEWNKLWDAQIDNTWENYWSAVPLGNPEQPLAQQSQTSKYQEWKDGQNAITGLRDTIPNEYEETVYRDGLNVGTWWGSLQARLGQALQAVKNTRSWRIPAAPGERSSLSGQFSALHPRLHYTEKFKEGRGVNQSSLRLFWQLMGLVYPGRFNGTEKLNAIELTKRMAWKEGGVAQYLGIESSTEENDYEQLIRFPNLSSIAAARFVYEDFDKNGGTKVRNYWNSLNTLIKTELPNKRDKFGSLTRSRPFQVPKTDKALTESFNGVMFSSKWLADDLFCSGEEKYIIQNLVETAHKEASFGEGSPADWWVIVLGDGDGMGKYITGSKLQKYEKYLNKSAIETNDNPQLEDFLAQTRKRMGPATHVGLNRALLDFSNRLVPYIAQKRYCGKVVYSGGDDVMAILPLADLPGFLLSLRAAWCGDEDPEGEFSHDNSGYWTPNYNLEDIEQRPHFTMGAGATISIGIVVAHKSVPLPNVLEKLWEAEKERAKKIYGKDGLCFRVIYGSGNTLEALMKGDLLKSWRKFAQPLEQLSPILYRLAQELPLHTWVTNQHLIRKAAEVLLSRRETPLNEDLINDLLSWLEQWEDWAYETSQQLPREQEVLGIKVEDLANILRFTAFWVDKMIQQEKWVQSGE